jgi:glycosyltransferase 2 family protein
MSPPMKSGLAFVARLVLSVAMLAFVARGIALKQVEETVLAVKPLMFLLAVTILLIQTLIMNARWMLIMRVIGAPLRFSMGLRIFLVSLWFNQALPSTVGGDLVRVWMLHAEHVSWGKAIKGVLADRVTALIALILLIIVGFPFLLMRIDDVRAIVAIGSLASAGVVGTLVLATLDSWPKAVRSTWPISGLAALGSLVRFLSVNFTQRGSLLTAAMLIHVLSAFTCYVLALGLHAGLTIADALLLVPPVILLSAIPISISGWGVRESAMVAGLATVGVSPAASLATSVLLGLASAAIGLIGGVVWLVSRQRLSFTGEQQAIIEKGAIAATRSFGDDAV